MSVPVVSFPRAIGSGRFGVRTVHARSGRGADRARLRATVNRESGSARSPKNLDSLGELPSGLRPTTHEVSRTGTKRLRGAAAMLVAVFTLGYAASPAFAGTDPAVSCLSTYGAPCYGYQHHFTTVGGWYNGSSSLPIKVGANCQATCGKPYFFIIFGSAYGYEQYVCEYDSCTPADGLFEDFTENQNSSSHNVYVQGSY